MNSPLSLCLPRKGRKRLHPICRALLCVEQLEDRRLLSRTVFSLDNSWQFIPQDVPGAASVSFVDSAWSTVTLPHTWNNLDGQDGGNNYYRGIGWYRRHYYVPDNLTGHELFIKFDGANYTTDLYVNGLFVGEHRGGFAAFVWDVTPYIIIGGDNVLAVEVDNASDLAAVPQSGDITWDGGLYRHVNLIVTDPLHISLTDYASPGVYLQQTNVSAASADVQITTKLQNDDLVPRQATVVANILDASGNLVQALTTDVSLDVGAGMDVVQSTTLANPHLWNGRADPYMYQVAVQVIDDTTGNVVDEVDQPLGLRYFSVDPNQGFYLNGQYLDLHGVGFHQDRLNEGWAISDADQIQDVSLIQDIGATFARLTLYQHPALTYSLLDQDGIIAWSDLPLIDLVVASPDFFNNAKQQLTEMILQNYNHPSVLFWGLYDELSDNGTAESYVQQLVQLAHQLDPSRLTAAATDLSDNKPINYLTDVTGFNKYYGWYYGTYYEVGSWADNIHTTYPNVPIGISEYGAGASIYQHQDNPGYPQYPAYSWHPEEYQDKFHEMYWEQLSSRPYLWLKSVWDMFDFAVDSRHEGDTPGRNDKGLVSYDRKTLKDSFYWYKANWSTDPVLYITGRRYINRPTSTTDIKIYSNLDAVTLSVNGVVVSTLTSTDHIFLWPGVQLAPGANDVEVSATAADGTVYNDKVTWYTPRDLQGVPFVRINFQPTGIPTPDGYLPDYGNVFDDRGNGYSYGWDTDNSANTYVRGVENDPLYDTGIAMEQPDAGQVWQIAVPNGTYDVHVVSGDPSNFDSIYEIAVQGVLTVSGGVNVLSRFQEAWRTVTVTNGLLAVTNADGSRNDKIDFIEINQMDQNPPMPMPPDRSSRPIGPIVLGGDLGNVGLLNGSEKPQVGGLSPVAVGFSEPQTLQPTMLSEDGNAALANTGPVLLEEVAAHTGVDPLGVEPAISAARNPQLRWEPSQNGLFLDWPQRHSATDSFPGGGVNSFPS